MAARSAGPRGDASGADAGPVDPMSEHADEHRRSGRSPGATAIAACIGWCLYAAYVFWQALAGPPIIWGDSTSYVAVSVKPLPGDAFWTGQRPPMLPLLIKMAGPSTGLIVTQTALAVVAWGILAWTTGRLVPVGWRRLSATLVVLGFGSVLPITLWNRSVLSESVSISTLALLVAAVLWTTRKTTWPRVAATAAVCLLFALERDAQLWTVGLFGASAGLFGTARIRTDRPTALRAGVLALCLLAICGVAEAGSVASGRTDQSLRDVLAVRVFPYPDRVSWFAEHGMPDGQAVDRLAAATSAPAPDAVKVVGVPPNSPSFRSLRAWESRHGQATYIWWLVTHPTYVVTEPLYRPERAFNFAQGNLTFYAAATGRVDSPLTLVMWPPIVGFVILSALALHLGIWYRIWRETIWRSAAVVTAIGVLAMLVAWHGDGQEVTRHTIEGSVEVRLGVWLLVIIGALRHTRTERDELLCQPITARSGNGRTEPAEDGPTAGRPPHGTTGEHQVVGEVEQPGR